MIQTDGEGKKQIQALCDVALKAGGLQFLPHVNKLLCSIRPLPPQTEGKKEGVEPTAEAK
jgi:hypothetical protein